jgi:serine/threonine protein kinase
MHPVARGHQTSLFDRLGDLGTGRLPANASLDRQRYVILDTIGKGGMGAVYLAHDTQQARPVAIKEMSQARLKNAGQLQQARQRFQQEAAMLQALQHANLPKVYGSFQENKRSYLVMEYIQGQSLFDILKQKNGVPLPIEDIISYGLQLCDVLIYLHSCFPPIIFRDLKPSNIMLRDDGHLFLIDFGIARFFSRERNHSDTEIFATPGYAPPEQYGGQTTPQSDIYSLGATLHHCLTGENPCSHTQTHLFHFTPVSRLNPQVPQPLSELVREMLSMQPQDRPTNIQEVRQRLQHQSPLHPNQIILGTYGMVSPSDPTVNANVATTTPPKPHVRSWFSTLLTSLSSVGIATVQQWLNALKQNKGITIGQILSILWRQLVGLSRNQRIWQRSFLFSWLAMCVLLLGGSIYLLRTVPGGPHLIGLVLIVFMLCLFGFTLSGKRLADARPRSLLTLMAAAWILAALMLQAEPDMEVLIHSSLQSLTLSQIGVFILIAGGLICLLRPAQRLVWLEQTLLGLLALSCAFLQYGFGLDALQRVWPRLSVELANILNTLLIITLIVLTLITLFHTPQPLRKVAHTTLVVVATSFTLLQYAFGFQEWQHILASDNWSPSMLQQLVILSFICTWVPLVCALLAFCLRQSWANRLALAVVALVVAMMLSYQGQQISFAQFPGNTHLLATPLLSAETLAQLVGPVLIFVICLTLFRLPHSRLFHALDHGVLLASTLICARMNDAFWQSQKTVPLSPNMDQSALSQQFTILAGQLPSVTVYLFLLGLPLILLTIALCHFWRQAHPLAQIDPWLKRLYNMIIVLEHLLTLALVSIAFILQGGIGALKPILTLSTRGTFASNSLTFLDILALLLLCILAAVIVKIAFNLLSRSPQQLGKNERWALFLATTSCLLLTIQQPDFLHLPLFTSEVQLTGNILHWHPDLIYTLFFVSLLIPSLLAFFWTRRSFFARYRELLRFSFLLVVICAMLQFVWPIFLPIGLIIFIVSVLLLIQIEKVE